MNDNTILWLWLSLSAVTGSRQTDRLLEAHGGDIERVYSLSGAEYADITGSGRLADRLADKSLDRAKEILGWCEENDVGILTPDDELYPERLRSVMSRPLTLYCLGEPRELGRCMTLAAVGTRRMTNYGSQSAYTISLEAARCGAVIVSGMAAGIDGVCHRGAMDGGGYTVAVLGCGIDRPYPEFHRELMREISEKGLVLTEFPPFTPPTGYNFPIRNRIISGISLCTLVVEGDVKSGAMITARSALYQGRDLCALPGKVGESSSEGTNLLIKEGARIVTCAMDILEPYRYVCEGLDLTRLSYPAHRANTSPRVQTPPEKAIPQRRRLLPGENQPLVEKKKRAYAGSEQKRAEPAASAPQAARDVKNAPSAAAAASAGDPPAPDLSLLTSDERKLYDAIGDDIVSPDRFFDELGGSRVLTMFSLMEIKGFVKSLPGGMYRKIK